MTENIVASISELLSPEIIGRLATASGLDRSMAGEAVSAAVPTILSSLSELVTKPGGARKLMSVLAEQSGDPADISTSLIGQAQKVASGNDLLSSLLGGQTPSVLASGLGNFLGVGTNAMQTVLSSVAPLVLGALARVQRAKGLDSDGLARMLGEQQDNIAHAIPTGLSKFLPNSGLAEASGLQRRASPPEFMRAASTTTTKARKEVEAERGASWPSWALGIAALGALLWTLMPSQDDGTTETASFSGRPAERSMLPPAENGNVMYFKQPGEHWTSIGTARNEYINQVIYNARGEALGTVRDLLVRADGKPAAAIISVGQYLGIGDKVVAVPFSAIRLEQRESGRRIIIDLHKEALQSAPSYEASSAVKQ